MALLPCARSQGTIDLFGTTIELPAAPKAPVFDATLSDVSIARYVEHIDHAVYQPFLDKLLQYKKEQHPDDWLYYQAIRKVAQYLSPKAEDYYRYTFFKWWLLVNSGYKSILTYAHPYLLFYVRSDETVYNIPSRISSGEQYICLNYHDYGTIDFEKYRFTETALPVDPQAAAFSYRVTNLPQFRQSDYAEKKVEFSDGLNQYSFRIKVNPQMKAIFSNYPVVDYDLQFNMPISKATYESLIPSLQKQVHGMKQREGVEFLMRFTRYAFLFKPDGEVFGAEKRLTPEQTLLSEFSDCEDRAALFFFLVKELYDLPMLVLTYPEHVTVAVQFNKPYGQTIEYNGMKYSVCEPSPQGVDLRVGQTLPSLRNQHYNIVYAYQPAPRR
ncbi:MAG TPA: hypothetical protein VD996_02035 [Chitinophagaceae bacterium]|nr:hypothetical protein [Chitinophagaceae bacterium]